MRFLFKLTLALVALIIVALLAVLAFLDRGARVAVERGATYALAVPTEAESLHLRPFSGGVTLSGLRVSNPDGFSESPLLSLGGASVDVAMKSLLSDQVEIQSLKISDVALRLEGRGTQTNYGVILDNLARFESKDGAPPASEGAEAGQPKRFLVREITIEGVRVDTDFRLGGAAGDLASAAASVTLPPIRLTNVGGEQGVTMPQLASKLLRALLEAAADGQVPGLSAQLAGDLRKSLGALEQRGRDLGKDLERAAKDLGRELESGAKGALEGLLKKKD